VAARARLRLRVAPRSSRTRVVGRHGDGWKVAVAAAPERGKANEAVVELLAGTLGLPRRDVSVVSGHTGREKIVELGGLAPDEIDRRLASAAAPPGRLEPTAAEKEEGE
jgi:uncharacterized protein (TIGR00251 family)